MQFTTLLFCAISSILSSRSVTACCVDTASYSLVVRVLIVVLVVFVTTQQHSGTAQMTVTIVVCIVLSVTAMLDSVPWLERQKSRNSEVTVHASL